MARGHAAPDRRDEVTARGGLSVDAPAATLGGLESAHAATARSAVISAGGNSRPRFSARRRMPAAARADSEYRAGAFGSSTSARAVSDDEHTPSALGHSEESAVENPPGHAVPDVGQRSKQLAEVPTAVRGEQSGYVLDEKPLGSNRLSDPGELEEEAGSLTGESCPSSCDGEVLTREAAAEEIDRRIFAPPVPPTDARDTFGRSTCSMHAPVSRVRKCHASTDCCNVIPDRDSGESLGEDGAAILVSLAEADVPPSGASESEVHAPDA